MIRKGQFKHPPKKKKKKEQERGKEKAAIWP